MIKIQENIQLAPLTTFGIGGSARYFTEVRTEDELRESFKIARERKVRFIVLGGGSNVLLPDDPLRALVVHIVSDNISFSGRELTADAGCNLSRLIRAAGEKSLGGWEKLAGIPGTIGGAVRGNAGAFGTEIKDWVTKVRAINVGLGETREFNNGECRFSYRHSFFKDNPDWLITRVTVKLNAVVPGECMMLMNETVAEREKRHLQNIQAAGSFFMNPVVPREIQKMFENEKGMPAREGRVPAGWLIEKAGMKGAKEGGAMASTQHPNYLVNTGGATAKDVRTLAERVKQAVMDKFMVLLEEEAVDLRDNI